MEDIRSCLLYRKCKSCKKVKHGSEFHNNKEECKKCIMKKLNAIAQLEKANKKLTEIGEWANRDLGLDYINKDKKIKLYSTDLVFLHIVSYKQAKSLYEKGKATVCNKNELYLQGRGNKYLAKKIIIESEYTCFYCCNFGDTVDHEIPQAKGGLWVENNLRCCCKWCNSKKSDMESEEFIRKLGDLVFEVQIKNFKKKIIGYNKNGIPIIK